jgi:hypothetical protein
MNKNDIKIIISIFKFSLLSFVLFLGFLIFFPLILILILTLALISFVLVV